MLVAGCGGGDPESFSGRVGRVADGDTVRLADGTRVRLVQVDAPELDPPECYGGTARAILARLLPAGTPVRVEYDGELDRVDRFGRRLGYVFAGDRNVNLTLVELGAAAPYFFGGDRGRYGDELLDAAEEARDDRRGLWNSCPAARLDPGRALRTSRR